MSFTDHRDFQRAVSLAAQLADTARGIARSYFRQPLAVEQKSDLSPVTIADREIEQALRQLIRVAFPTHGIRGEEFAAEPGTEFTWFLDPIDGTKSFITGFPLFGTLIALLHENHPVIGVIEAPATNERWLGCAGRPTTFNGTTARTSGCERLAGASVYSTTADTIQGDYRRRYDALTQRTGLRRFGGDCYLYGLLASGHCDLVVEAALKPHDFMALIPVIEGAGGRISDWNGAPLTEQSEDRVIAAATESLWREAITILADR